MPYETVKLEQLKTLLKLVKDDIYTPVAQLNVVAWRTTEPVPYAERMSGKKVTVSPGDKWGELWDCAWFHFTGKVPDEVRGAKVVLLIDVNGELCLVDEEGTPMQGLTNVNSEFDRSLGHPGKRVVLVSEAAQGGEKIELWGDAGCNDLFGHDRGGTLKEAQIAICREDVRQLYYDMEVLLKTAECLPIQSPRRARIVQSLYEASWILKERSVEKVAQARSILMEQLSKQGGDPVLTISAIGHAHIDLAWLWPIRETIRKGARTFSTALRMMEQYPDYVFGASQPQLYAWIQQYYPKLFEQVKQRVQEGRWELQGAMWVESDTNVPSGESLVRQILYGKRYYQQEFGQDVRTLWLPDVFGYTASLPQLLKKSGVDYMMTQKLSWSEYNQHPHHTFFWEGIDGSKVITHMPPEDTYNSPAAPESIAKIEKDYLDKNISEHSLMLFGIGDGGGGPGEGHLERLSRMKNLLGLSPVVQRPSSEFFELLREEEAKFQTWTGELYLEKHQGTYTTQARNKRYNRKLEKLLRELEFAAVFAEQFTQYRYPAEELEEIWKEVLLYQFHDILPGSSITRVYDESLARYAAIHDRVETLLKDAYQQLLSCISTSSELQGSKVVFNSLSWDRHEWIQTGKGWRYVGVPAMGYAVLPIEEVDISQTQMGVRVSASERLMENELLCVRFNEEGAIISIYDKENSRELVPAGCKANVLALYDDQGDAWDFRHDYRQLESTELNLDSVVIHHDGPVAGFVQQYTVGGSVLTQRITLTAGSRRIDFTTHVDWHESGKMLRTSFPVNVYSDVVNCEIQFGHVKRATHRNTMWDFAKDEICAHHWIDLSEADYGVALLNDCKYGHRAHGNVLDLNLLRSPSYPDPEADRAEHEFTYSLYPHPGNHVQAEIVKRGYELNVPFQVISSSKVSQDESADSSLERLDLPFHSFLRLDHPNVMIETVKKAEDHEDMIIRLYETAGSHAQTSLRLGFDVKEAWECNLMEEDGESVELRDNSIELSFTPFEIKTIKLRTS